MNPKLALIAGLLVLGSFAGFALTGPQDSFADKGGCPNANSASGAGRTSLRMCLSSSSRFACGINALMPSAWIRKAPRFFESM